MFIRFPIMELAAALSRSPQTCKRSLNKLEQVGMIMRVRQGIGEASHICVLLSKSELDIIYQYAAPTKAETFAGMKEIVPVIKDLLTKAIVENAIRKLEKIPEPECSKFVAGKLYPDKKPRQQER